MKIGVVVLILISMSLITIPAFSLSMEQKYMQKLQNIQSEEDLYQILEDFTNEPAYQQMCRELFEKVTKQQEELKNSMGEGQSIEQLQLNKQFVKKWEEFNENFKLFNDVGCMASKSKWLTQEPEPVKISNLTREECDDIFERKAELLDEYHRLLPDIVTGNEPDFVKVADQQDVLARQWKAECQPFENFKGEIVCGVGTIMNEKEQCVPDPKFVKSNQSSKSGGCLIATATYGSELAPQVQQLRELRDSYLMKTESGYSFMIGFNELYYSFSPTIADLERESPLFKEAVKLTITPLIFSLSILNHVEVDSESKVLGYGIGIILLNIGMYFVAPALIISKFVIPKI